MTTHRALTCLTVGLLLAPALGVQATRAGTTITVDTPDQGVTSGHCSLQEAIYSAEFGDNIALDQTDPDNTYRTGCEPGTGNGDTIELPGGTLTLTELWDGDAHNPFGPTATPIIFKTMVIDGNGTTLRWIPKVAGAHSRLFAVGSATIRPTSGVVTGVTYSGTGDLTLNHVYVKDFSVHGGNGVDGGGGGLGAGGAIYVGKTTDSTPALTVIDSTFANNGATGGNGAAGSTGGGGGLGGNGGSGSFASGVGYAGGGGGGARGDGASGGGGGGGGTVFNGGDAFFDAGRGNFDGGPGGYLCGAAGGNFGSGSNDGNDAPTSCPGGGGGGAGIDVTINPYASFDGGDGSYGGGGGGGEHHGGTSYFGGGGGAADSCADGQCAGDGGFGGGGGSPDGHAPTGTFGGNGNSAGGGGGGALGGAIFNDSGNVLVENSTFEANAVLRGLDGGGTHRAGDSGAAIFSRNGSLTVRNSTISDGAASGAGGGIVVVRDGATTTFVLDNTIIANNGANECIVTGTVATNGSAGNLITANDNCPQVVATGDPQLGVLANNAPGDTPTMAIHARTSPAVDAADDATALGTDQRGVSRPEGPHADIGAYEAVQSADLQLTKSVSSSTALPGDTITYTLGLRNAGPDDAHGVTVSDTLSSALTFASCQATQDVVCAEKNGTVTATIETLPVDTTATISILATVKQGTTDGLVVANTANASAESPDDPDGSNNSASASFTVGNRADLLASESVVKLANQQLRYLVTVKNLGPYQTRQVTLTDPIPAGTRFVSVASGPWTCNALASGSTGTLQCTLAALDASATASLTLVVKVMPMGRSVTNTVTAGAATFDPTVANNTASLTTKVGAAK